MNTLWLHKFFMISIFFTTSHAYAQKKILKRVTCMMHDAHTVNIDLGTVRLYFDRQPAVTVLPTPKEGQTELFIPLADVSDTRILQQLNALQSKFYRIHAQLVKDPMIGIQITITYDPGMVLVKHELFQSADMQQGIVLYMYNQDLIKSIGNSENALLKVL